MSAHRAVASGINRTVEVRPINLVESRRRLIFFMRLVDREKSWHC